MSAARRNGGVNGHCLSLERSYDGGPEIAFFTAAGSVVIVKHVARIMIVTLRRESIVWNII
jgi:hypothetical protein